MKQIIFLTILVATISSYSAEAQEIQTLFKGNRPSGGYAGLSNKFTAIKGDYANLAEIYGGWFIQRRLLLGISAAASTNNIRVPREFSVDPTRDLSWQYGQFGLVTEYVFWSNRVVHFNLTLFSGAGFTVQYQRHDWDDWDDHHDDFNDDLDRNDVNFFYVMEPGAQLEVNVFKWLRLSPGVSYRKAFGSDAMGLKDNDLSDWSYNVTLKIGKF